MTVVPGAPVRLVITGPPPTNAIVGAGFSLTVTAQDWFGNTATSYNGGVTVVLARHAGKGRLGGDDHDHRGEWRGDLFQPEIVGDRQELPPDHLRERPPLFRDRPLQRDHRAEF